MSLDDTLRVLLQTNEEHMTHVENEKYQFISLYLVATSCVLSAILAALFDSDLTRDSDMVFIIVVIALLFIIALGCILYKQICRWDDVFKNHKEVFNSTLVRLLLHDLNYNKSLELYNLVQQKKLKENSEDVTDKMDADRKLDSFIT